MRRRATSHAFTLTATLLLAAACSKSDVPLVGKWQSTADESLIEFKSDGTVVNSDDNGPLFEGHYRFVDPSTIRIELGGPAGVTPERTYHIVVAGDDLTVTDEKGKNDTYRRVR
jgi:hypothetical protein